MAENNGYGHVHSVERLNGSIPWQYLGYLGYASYVCVYMNVCACVNVSVHVCVVCMWCAPERV